MRSGEVVLRAPRAAERAALESLILRSKAVWGYDASFLSACREELRLPEDFAVSGLVVVASGGRTLLGCAEVVADPPEAELEKLFVAPDALGRGVGRLLFEWAVRIAAERGATALFVTADPDALPFYRRMGAVYVGTAPSGSIPGRVLPRLTAEIRVRRAD